jgi:hypothetical protein
MLEEILMTFYDCCFIGFCAILFLHYLFLFVDEDSRYQKKKFKKSLERIFDYLASMTKAGDRYPIIKVIYKNKEFAIGIYKKEHNYRYTTYDIFINGDEAGTFHILGDCCKKYYYFETMNNRYKHEVMDIVRAGAKEINKRDKERNKAVARETNSWNEYSYFK